MKSVYSLCLHESLPRKNQRGSPGASGKGTGAIGTPKPNDQPEEETERRIVNGDESGTTNATDSLLNRHYETIDESKGKCPQEMISAQAVVTQTAPVATHQPMSNPTVVAMKSGEVGSVQRGKNPLVSDANSTSSGASDMSDYIETLSSCSRGSIDTITSIPANSNMMMGGGTGSTNNISVSPRKSSNMKPRSGKEYFKIDRSMFKD